MADATDVPFPYDVVIDGHGYRFADTEDRRASFTYSPTFVQRTNVQGDYSDNQQDFWLTVAQRDWMLGEQQRYFRGDEAGSRRYWQGTNLDLSTPGQVKIRSAVTSLGFAASVRATSYRGADSDGQNTSVVAASTTNLYEVEPDGTITDLGAHSLGAAPSRAGITSDGTDVYLSTTDAGTVGVRKWDGSSFSTFGPSAGDSLSFLNNTLYGLRWDTASLVRWDTSGVQTEIFQWKQADGSARSTEHGGRVEAYGGKLMILWHIGQPGADLWLYDGTAPALVAVFPHNFASYDIEVLNGVAFISGGFVKPGAGSNIQIKPAIYYYANGSIGLLWRAESYRDDSAAFHSYPSLTAVDANLIFNDDTRGQLMSYSMADGGVHSIGTYTVAGGTSNITASHRCLLHTRNQSTAYLYPSTSVASSATITMSLVDYDSSLDKTFNALMIDADIPTGATVTASYRLEDLEGSYTDINGGAALTAGTEYPLGVNGRAISVKLTLTKGSSTSGPALKRVYVRAAPLLQTFKRREYVLDLSGRDGEMPVQLRDESVHPKDGLAMAEDLVVAATATSPVTITDHFGTFEGIIEPDGFQLISTRPEEFVGVVRVREV